MFQSFFSRFAQLLHGKRAESVSSSAASIVPVSSCSTPSVQVLTINSAFPPYEYETAQVCQAYLDHHLGNISEQDRQFVHKLFAKSYIDRCHIALPIDKVFVKMGREEYSAHIHHSLLDISVRAGQAALQTIHTQYGIPHHKVTHLVFGTMTTLIQAPSLDVAIAFKLQLPNVKRLNVNGMGCLTGFRLVGLCQDIARADEDHVVLLVVADIRSALGNLMPTQENNHLDKAQAVVAALFRDGAAAAVFTAKHKHSSLTTKKTLTQHSHSHSHTQIKDEQSEQKDQPIPLFTMMEHQSKLVEDSLDLAHLHEKDDGSQILFLSKDLPICVANNLEGVVYPLLAKHSVKLEDCLFSIHTGGPRVLRAVTDVLHLQPAQMAASWYLMKYKGNLSGSSNLLVMRVWQDLLTGSQEIIQDDRVTETLQLTAPFHTHFSNYHYMVGMSFGPGVGIEVVLLKINRSSD